MGEDNKKKSCKRILKTTIIVLLCLVLTLLFVIVLLMVVSNLMRRSKGRKAKDRILKRYRYTRVDKKKKKQRKTTGFVTIEEFGENQNYVSYEEDGEVFMLISEKGTTEYECSGSCRCVQSEKRRANSFILRPVYFLVAAVGSALAVNLAKEQFDQTCSINNNNENLDSSSSNCPENYATVIAEVEDCNPLFDGIESDEDTEEGDWEGWVKRREEREFLCSGNCQETFFAFDRQDEKAFGDHITNEDFDFVKENYWKPGKCIEMELKITYKNHIVKSSSPEEQIKEAEKAFMNTELFHFCTWESQVQIKEWEDGKRASAWSMCSSTLYHYPGENPNVECVFAK